MRGEDEWPPVVRPAQEGQFRRRNADHRPGLSIEAQTGSNDVRRRAKAPPECVADYHCARAFRRIARDKGPAKSRRRTQHAEEAPLDVAPLEALRRAGSG